jgi:hypothetical protein
MKTTTVKKAQPGNPANYSLALLPDPEVGNLIGISPSGVGNVLKRVQADQ